MVSISFWCLIKHGALCAGGGGWWHEEPMENVLRHPDPSHDGVLGDGVKVRHGGDGTQLSDQIMQQWFTSDQFRQHSVKSRIISIPHRTRFLARWDENCNPSRRQVESNFIKSYNYSPWERLRLKTVTQAWSKIVNILMDCCLYLLINSSHLTIAWTGWPGGGPRQPPPPSRDAGQCVKCSDSTLAWIFFFLPCMWCQAIKKVLLGYNN